MSVDLTSVKAELRSVVRGEIAALTGDYISSSDEGIYLNVVSLPEFLDARNIMLYYSVEREPCTLKIADKAFSMGKTVAFPYCYRAGIMDARVVSSLDELSPALLGIPAPPESARVIAPEDLDFVIVPAMTYDMTGFRLGYGGGYYDRYLPGMSAFTVGLARALLVKTDLPRASHDIAVRCVVTECGLS